VSAIVYSTTRSILESAHEDVAPGGLAEAAWAGLVHSGLHAIGVPEERSGSGGDIADARSAVRAAAACASAVPLAEALFGVAPIVARVGTVLPDGVGTATTFGRAGTLTATACDTGWQLNGTIGRVPFGRQAQFVAVATPLADGTGGVLAVVPSAGLQVEPGMNLADEPRDDLTCTRLWVGYDVACTVDAEVLGHLRRLAALARALQLSAAVDEVVAASTRYANERVQFGRPIAKFQAIAHRVAVMIGESAVLAAASDAALTTLGTEAEWLAVAAAKARASAGSDLVARSGHQVFGALGFTQEHPLHHLTRRVWSWQHEVGAADHWYGELGAGALAAGSARFWSFLTDSSLGVSSEGAA
jgi:acyl-CoA dehydrogenase